MKVRYEDSIEYKALNRISAINGNIVLREDFANLGSYRQISRVICKFIEQKKLVKIGSGIYAKSYVSEYSGRPLIKNGVHSALREALKRLNIEYEPGSAEKAYNEGKSTQVPVRNIVKLKSRCRRRIAYKNNKLIFEKDINAK
jgi:hypothetical protein